MRGPEYLARVMSTTLPSTGPEAARAAAAPAARGSAAAGHRQFPATVIEPSQGWARLGLRDLWHYRELIYFLTWREIKVRYTQTALGALWAVIQPVCTMVLFSVVFGRFAKVPSDGLPYPLFSLAALVPWSFFSNGISQGAASLVTSANLVTRVYFPRLAIPASAVLSGIVDFGIAFVLLCGLTLANGIVPGPRLVWFPAFLLLGFATCLGAALWLAALNVEYRDVRHVMPFLTQFWMYATPIAWPSSMLPPALRTLAGLNPMSGVVDGFRWSLLGAGAAPGAATALSAAVSVVMLVSGALYFRRMERTFADRI